MPTFSRIDTAHRTRVRGGMVVEGLDGIMQTFATEAATIRPRASKVVVDHAGEVAGFMRDMVAVDEGDVLDSITSDSSAMSDGSAVYADAGPDSRANKAAFVARFLEHGTVKMAPQPFVGPSANRILPKFAQAIAELSKL